MRLLGCEGKATGKRLAIGRGRGLSSPAGTGGGGQGLSGGWGRREADTNHALDIGRDIPDEGSDASEREAS